MRDRRGHCRCEGKKVKSSPSEDFVIPVSSVVLSGLCLEMTDESLEEMVRVRKSICHRVQNHSPVLRVALVVASPE